MAFLRSACLPLVVTFCSIIGCGKSENQAARLQAEQEKIKPILLTFEQGVVEACQKLQEIRNEIDVAVKKYHELLQISEDVLHSDAGKLRRESYSTIAKAKANEERMKVISILIEGKKERESAHAISYEKRQEALEEMRKQKEISQTTLSWGLLELEKQDLAWHADVNKTIFYKDDELFGN